MATENLLGDSPGEERLGEMSALETVGRNTPERESGVGWRTGSPAAGLAAWPGSWVPEHTVRVVGRTSQQE